MPRQGHLVAWVTTPDIDQIERIGALDVRHEQNERWADQQCQEMCTDGHGGQVHDQQQNVRSPFPSPSISN